MENTKQMAMTHLMLLSFLCFFMEIEGSLSGFDKITGLPGQPKVGFQQYSGYVIIDKNNKTETAFFYYFVEAEKDPASKPLVLWFNGGMRKFRFLFSMQNFIMLCFWQGLVVLLWV